MFYCSNRKKDGDLSSPPGVVKKCFDLGSDTVFGKLRPDLYTLLIKRRHQQPWKPASKFRYEYLTVINFFVFRSYDHKRTETKIKVTFDREPLKNDPFEIVVPDRSKPNSPEPRFKLRR